MRITIAQRLRPFTHLPGEACLIPGTLYAAQAYPAKLLITTFAKDEPAEVACIEWKVQGPVKDFTIEQDLEKGCVRVWGHAKNGYFRYHITSGANGYAIVVERGCEVLGLTAASAPEYPIVPRERLFLGADKQQDWTNVCRRFSLSEIFPFWLRLGQFTPPMPLTTGGTASLLQDNAFDLLFLTGFEGVLYPRLFDAACQGIQLPQVEKDANPTVILSEGARRIRSLFFRQEERIFSFLPEVFHCFHSGRYINIDCGCDGELDFEWRSRKFRRLIFRCHQSGNYVFLFPEKLKTYRLREQIHLKGEIKNNGQSLSLDKDRVYYFDCFES